MYVVIVFASVEGQTRKIARNMAGTVQSLGHDVTVFDAADIEDVDLDLAEAIIAAAPVHAGSYPSPLMHWLTENAKRLNVLPGAFVSVSLSAASVFEAEKRDLAGLTEDGLARTGWKPSAIHYAAGALRYTKYDYFKRLLMRYIAGKEGGDTDTAQDHEYTDWDALADFVGKFMAGAKNGEIN